MTSAKAYRPSHRRLVMTDTPQLLLVHHLKALKLPTSCANTTSSPTMRCRGAVAAPRFISGHSAVAEASHS